MNKLFRLIYVNMVDNLNINMIKESKQINAKDSSEVKLIITAILGILFGIVLYNLYDLAGAFLVNKYYILVLAFVLSTFTVFFSNLVTVEDTLFLSNDVEMLYSFPLTKAHIVLSKLFNIYIRNLFFICIINIPAIISFASYIKVSDLVGLLYLLFSLIIPFVPIVITSLLSYGNAYLKARRDHKVLFNIIRVSVFALMLAIVYLALGGIKAKGIDNFINEVFNNLSKFYPFINMVKYSLIDGNPFYIFLGLVVPIYILYIFIVFLANNYIKLISILKGIRVSNKFILGDAKNNGKLVGMIKKEITTILHDKPYFMHTIGLEIIGTLLVLVICVINPLERLKNVENIVYYYSTFMPSIIACLSSLCCTTISSLSLERSNLAMLKSMPLRFGNILLYKVLTNIVICLPLLLINLVLITLFMDTSSIVILISFIYAFFTILFISILGITLDFVFIDNKERDQNVIIKQRLITFVPIIVSGVIGISPFLLPVYFKYYYMIGSYALMEFVGVIICVIYLLINYKKLLNRIEL